MSQIVSTIVRQILVHSFVLVKYLGIARYVRDSISLN